MSIGIVALLNGCFYFSFPVQTTLLDGPILLLLLAAATDNWALCTLATHASIEGL